MFLDGPHSPPPEPSKDLTVPIFHALLPQALKLAAQVSQTTDDSKLEIAHLATILKDCLSKARKEIENLEGGELSVRDQDWIIRRLQEEIHVRKTSTRD